MGVATASVPAGTAHVRMSTWRAFWSLLGGAIVGCIGSGLALSVLRAVLKLDDPGGRSSFVWVPFAPTSDWARAADLAGLGLVVLACGACAQRISRDSAIELPLPAAAAAMAGLAVVAVVTHSWWSVIAFLPVAFVLRRAGRPTRPPWSWGRRARVLGIVAIVYAAVTGAAFAALQLHPLTASPNMSCSGPAGPGILAPIDPRPGIGPLLYPSHGLGRAAACVDVRNNAWARTASVLGVASSALPAGTPWRVSLAAVRYDGSRVRFAPAPATPIRAGREQQLVFALHLAACGPGAAGRTEVLRAIPLEVRVAGAIGTESVALTRPVATRCPG